MSRLSVVVAVLLPLVSGCFRGPECSGQPPQACVCDGGLRGTRICGWLGDWQGCSCFNPDAATDIVSSPPDADVETDSGVVPDLATACAYYCQTFSMVCDAAVQPCQAMCICQASVHPTCVDAIAAYQNCASGWYLDCDRGDPIFNGCIEQRATRDRCIAANVTADASPTCNAAFDAGTPDHP